MIQYLIPLSLPPAIALGVIWEWRWRKHDALMEVRKACSHYGAEDITPKWAGANNAPRKMHCHVCGHQWFEPVKKEPRD